MVKNLSAIELLPYINSQEYQIIDLRKKDKYEESHINGAIHVDGEIILAGDFKKLKKQKIILYCDRGGISMRVANLLDKNGYEVRNVIGGYRQLKQLEERYKIMS